MPEKSKTTVTSTSWGSSSSSSRGRRENSESRRRREKKETTTPKKDEWRLGTTEEKTESIVWSPPRQVVPSLTNIILDRLAQDPETVTTDVLDVLDSTLATALLKNIMVRQALNTRIAMAFIDSRHDELAGALEKLDLIAGMDRVGHGYLPRSHRF